MSGITIEVDTVVHAAYIKLSDAPVVRTVDFNGQIMIDLDEFGIAVGIEVLDERVPLPFTELVSDFHVHTDVADLLRLIRPDVSSFLELSHGNDGATTTRSAGTLTAF